MLPTIVPVPSVLLVDDVDEVRAILRTAMRLRGGFVLVAEAATGGEAVTRAEQHQPELVVLDLGLPDIAGHDVLHRLRVAAPDARIVIFTGTQREEGLIPSTADAFVGKDA